MQIVAGSATIRRGKLSASGPGDNEALEQDNGGAKIALSQLVGRIEGDDPASLQCFDNYDQNMTTVNCQSAAAGK